MKNYPLYPPQHQTSKTISIHMCRKQPSRNSISISGQRKIPSVHYLSAVPTGYRRAGNIFLPSGIAERKNCGSWRKRLRLDSYIFCSGIGFQYHCSH